MFKRRKLDNKFKKRNLFLRKKVCRLCRDKSIEMDYKNIKFLERFINERGKIISSRITGNCAKHQRSLSQAIKRARFVALLPYTR
ncbi:MAG: 30S ribosomal protein S18 [Candidatus Omnitrophica bacterium]|nr:30S ribosomal protein S18 [Candidatus Omnitrophota bacterium]